MNNHSDKESLLAEVLAEASPGDFRAATLSETLRLVRRQRQFRQARRTVGVLTAMSLLTVLIVQQFSKPTTVSQPLANKAAKQSYELVRTQPMLPGAVISTMRFSATGFAASVPKVTEIATVGGGFRSINDDELLSLLADKPAVLIRTGPNSEELVFANADDQRSFLKN
jgi:hypothetical protein